MLRGGERREGGTAVWLHKDEARRSSIVTSYLGPGSALTKRHYSQSPCSHGPTMRMFSQAEGETD